MAEYVLRAELTVGGGFGDDDPRAFLAARLKEAVVDFPMKGEVRVEVIGSSGPPHRFGVPDDPEATEHLRTQLIAVTEAERRALNNAGLFIAASSALQGVQTLAVAVLNVANRGGVNATRP